METSRGATLYLLLQAVRARRAEAVATKRKITLMVPGRTTFVTIDVAKQEATTQYRNFNLFDTMSYLHRNPGPHKTKGPNWSGSKAWPGSTTGPST